jgi:hypothetical protein
MVWRNGLAQWSGAMVWRNGLAQWSGAMVWRNGLAQWLYKIVFIHRGCIEISVLGLGKHCKYTM